VKKADPKVAALALYKRRYPKAKVLFLAGSVMRGQGTAHSDLDIVVVFDRLKQAYRESFHWMGWPVEAFVHDPATIRWFFREIDGRRGHPNLPTMVSEGLEIPGANELSRSLKKLANRLLKTGPLPLSAEDLRSRRYGISDALDDLLAPRNRGEMLATLSGLYAGLADFYLRANGHWSAGGKSIPRQLAKVDWKMARKFKKAFEAAFGSSDARPIIRMADQILKPHGGRLWEGFKRKAPKAWRTK
jgi:hypothetical protein